MLPAAHHRPVAKPYPEAALAGAYLRHPRQPPALDAVLADSAAAGATRYLLGGDYCMLGGEPAAVLSRLRELPADTIWLRGNTERWIAHPDRRRHPLAADRRGMCRGRRRDRPVGRSGTRGVAPRAGETVAEAGADGVIFCHASPKSDMIGFTDVPASGDGAAADSGLQANTIVCGHTHIQFVREIGVLQVVNPGSAGLPFDGDPRAAYGLLHEDGSFEPRRVEYDVEAAIDAYGDNYAEWARTASADGCGPRGRLSGSEGIRRSCNPHNVSRKLRESRAASPNRAQTNRSVPPFRRSQSRDSRHSGTR